MSLPTDIQNLLDEGRADVRGMLRLQFGTGTYGFIRSNQPLTYGGLEYIPGGILQVSDIETGIGFEAIPFTISLAASPNDGLTPDVLQTIEDEDYRDRPVTIYDAHFHPDTGVLLGVLPIERGYVDNITHDMNGENGYTIILNCEKRSLDYTRTNGRKRTPADQRRRDPTDRIMQHIAKRGREEILWGRLRGK